MKWVDTGLDEFILNPEADSKLSVLMQLNARNQLGKIILHSVNHKYLKMNRLLKPKALKISSAGF
jgi:hypothetical protein